MFYRKKLVDKLQYFVHVMKLWLRSYSQITSMMLDEWKCEHVVEIKQGAVAKHEIYVTLHNTMCSFKMYRVK